jgi:hypothetical protein
MGYAAHTVLLRESCGYGWTIRMGRMLLARNPGMQVVYARARTRNALNWYVFHPSALVLADAGRQYCTESGSEKCTTCPASDDRPSSHARPVRLV